MTTAYQAQTTVDTMARIAAGVDPWIAYRDFRLREPWYLYEGTGRIRAWLRETTPAAFARRNIWSGNRILRRT